MKFKKLTPEEEKVIIYKGTEKAFSGEYCQHREKGTYICKRCRTPLYESEYKFNSNCGWVSFDDEIPGTIKQQIDTDDKRTEITCHQCGAHLGHIFHDEGFTDKNLRHCVNSISLDFISGQD